MGALADALPHYDAGKRGAHGKAAQCDIYGPGDIDDWRAVLAIQGRDGWDVAQAQVDKALGVTEPVSHDVFNYHWRRKCGHWTAEQRTEQL